MIEQWREILYPLGFLSSLAFTLRFLFQWIYSEKIKESAVTTGFWQLSIAGNIFLFLHSFIQIQFHVCVVQACNAVIAWRNLNLMNPKRTQWKLVSVISMLAVAIIFSTLAFAVQGLVLDQSDAEWFRTPVLPWGSKHGSEISWLWHGIGSFGILLFNSRFWVQWWEAETSRKSYLSASFWWLSLIGSVLSLAYFARLGDVVNYIGPLFGLIPYIRNLMLIRQAKQKLASAEVSQ